MILGDGQAYELRVVGHLDDRWSSWFEGLVVTCHDDGTCTLTGPVVDQAQLHGVLARLRDIGAPLMSLRALDVDDLTPTERERLSRARPRPLAGEGRRSAP